MNEVDTPRILLVHNRYRDRAGEDLSFDADHRLLSENGISLTEYIRDNRDIDESGDGPLKVGLGTTWSSAAQRDIRRLLRTHRVDVAHFHNTFPLISPAPYWACRDSGVPVVQTLRNFRIFCSPGIFFRDGHVCEDCTGRRVTWPGVVHACYRSSRSKSAAVSMMQTIHGSLRTWSRMVDAYVVPSPFMRAKLAECGLPEARIYVRPDLVEVDVADDVPREDWALFLGRLTVEKGILTLLEAIRRTPDVTFKVIGSGPLEERVNEAIAKGGLRGRVELLGSVSHEDAVGLLRKARFLVVPSEWYETFGRVVVEAFACETPVIASRLGALADAVEDQETGLQFEPGDAADLADKLTWAIENARAMSTMTKRGRELYETRYGRTACLRPLLDLYRTLSAGSGGPENRSSRA